jgi:hypothetical protein
MSTGELFFVRRGISLNFAKDYIPFYIKHLRRTGN